MTCETNSPPRQGSLSSAGEECGSQRLMGPSQCCVSPEAKVQGSLGQCSGKGNGTPLRHSCLENPVDGGAWWAAVHGVTQSRTRLKRLSMHALEKETATHSVFLPGDSQGRGAWRAAVCGVAQSRTRLKRLSSSSVATSQREPPRGLTRHQGPVCGQTSRNKNVAGGALGAGRGGTP